MKIESIEFFGPIEDIFDYNIYVCQFRKWSKLLSSCRNTKKFFDVNELTRNGFFRARLTFYYF